MSHVCGTAAAGLMLAKRYAEAGAAYEHIAQTSPEDRAVALAQVGVARYFLGQYAGAISYYEQALAAGEDASTMNDNIQEAREALRRQGRATLTAGRARRRWLPRAAPRRPRGRCGAPADRR